MATQIATFNRFTFSFQDKIIEHIHDHEYVEVYSHVVIIESNNPKFKIGEKIDQISVCISLHFENEDGSEM